MNPLASSLTALAIITIIFYTLDHAARRRARRPVTGHVHCMICGWRQQVTEPGHHWVDVAHTEALAHALDHRYRDDGAFMVAELPHGGRAQITTRGSGQ